MEAKATVDLTVKSTAYWEGTVDVDDSLFEDIDDDDERRDAIREAATEQAIEMAKDEASGDLDFIEHVEVCEVEIDGESARVPEHLRTD